MSKLTTEEIQVLISEARLDFKTIENEALNFYLPRIFLSCPFSEKPCIQNCCCECSIFKETLK